MSCDSDLALATTRGKRAMQRLRFVLFFFLLLPAIWWVRMPPRVEAQQLAAPGPTDVKTINPTFTTIDVPGDWGSVGISGINTAGEMVGTFAKANNGENVHSFK